MTTPKPAATPKTTVTPRIQEPTSTPATQKSRATPRPLATTRTLRTPVAPIPTSRAPFTTKTSPEDGVSLPGSAPPAARKVESPGGAPWSLQDGSEAAEKPKITRDLERPRGLQRDLVLDRQTRDNVDMRPSDPGPRRTPQAHPPVAGPHDAVSSARFTAGASAAKRPCLAVAEGRSDVRPWQQVPDFEAVSAALRSRYFPRRSCQPSGP
ncbi:hypothetical protein ISCGN_008453 [Ixodes scapularis]